MSKNKTAVPQKTTSIPPALENPSLRRKLLNRRFLTMSEDPRQLRLPILPHPIREPFCPRAWRTSPPMPPLLPMTISTPPALVNPSPSRGSDSPIVRCVREPKATMLGQSLAPDSQPILAQSVTAKFLGMKESGFVATDEDFRKLRAEMVSRVSRRMHQSID